MYTYHFDELYNASNNEDFEFMGIDIHEVKQSLVNFKRRFVFLKQNIESNLKSDPYSSNEKNNIISIRDTISSIIEGRSGVAVLSETDKKNKNIRNSQ